MSAPRPQLRAPCAPRPRPARSARRCAGAGDTTRRIADSIVAAIVERRLMPGSKLAEQKLADLFGVSRTLVRQALFQLRDQLITLEPARGAFVAEPSVDEARQVFAVRRMLEAEMTARRDRLTPSQIERAARAPAAEKAAIAATTSRAARAARRLPRRAWPRMLGNAVLAQMLGELISRCALITLMYQTAHAAEHSNDEHVGHRQGAGGATTSAPCG